MNGCNFIYADMTDSILRNCDLKNCDFQYCHLEGIDLRGSDLRGADLQGATLDYASFPLCCGGSYFKCSERLVQQLFAHIRTLVVMDASADMRAALAAIKGEAEKSHRAIDLGLVEDPDPE